MIARLLACVIAVSAFAAAANHPRVSRSSVSLEQQHNLHALATHIGGRVERRGTSAAPEYVRQWPGTYFETQFEGRDVYFKVGRGDEILKISLDHRELQELSKPAPGFYHIEKPGIGKHILRVQVITESQAGPTEFDGFYGGAHTKDFPIAPPPRQIEFIGDSHTVGYGNTSPKRECTEDEVWKTTDTSQGIPALVADRFSADYQVNAISGRGIVRNYNGFAGDTLPIAYPFTLLDHTARYEDPDWHPQVIVISLGTNDFSTPLHDGEKWKTRDELHADYEKTYLEFLHQLRSANPDAYFLLWATDMSDGEIASEVQRVAGQARKAGEQKIAYVPANGLEFTACNFHPSLDDDRKIAGAVSAAIAGHLSGWKP